MISGVENSTQTLDRSLENNELRHGEDPEIDFLENDFSTNEVTNQLIGEQFKLTTEPISGISRNYSLF